MAFCRCLDPCAVILIGMVDFVICVRLEMAENHSLEKYLANAGFSGFEDMFNKTYPSLVSYASHYVSLSEAEEIVQDLFVHIYENPGKIKIRESLMPYLYRSVKNRCLTFISKEDTHARILSSLRTRIIDSGVDMTPLTVSEVLTHFETALSALPAEQREAFELSRFHNMTYAEIALEQGVSLKTVQYRVKVAVEKLNGMLSEFLPVSIVLMLLNISRNSIYPPPMTD